MKFFRENGTPIHQPETSETTPTTTKRRMPFARRFVSVDGEKTLFIEEREVSPPPLAAPTTVTTPTTIDDAAATSSFRSWLECGHDLFQLTLEPPTIMDTTTTTAAATSTATFPQVCPLFDYSHAIKTALLLDDEDESLVKEQQHNDDDDEVPPPFQNPSLVDSTVDDDLQYRRNKNNLRNGESSPGAIRRLTKEGLQRHEEPKTHRLAGTGGVAAFSRERAQRRRHLRDSNPHATSQRRYSHPERSLLGKLKKFSSAPNLQTTTTESKRMETKRQKERQRQREAQKAKQVDNATDKVENPVLKNEAKKKRSKRNNKKDVVVSLLPKKLSSNASSLQESPCVLCGKRGRTHIAIPCMHFSYCEKCAQRLKRNQEPCRVCGMANASYKQVLA